MTQNLQASQTCLYPQVNIPAGNKRVSAQLVRGRSTAQLVEEEIPRTWAPGVLHLITRGLLDATHHPVLPSCKHCKHTIEEALSHLVDDRRRVKLWWKQSQLVPAASEAGLTILPGVHEVATLKYTVHFQSLHKRIDGYTWVIC